MVSLRLGERAIPVAWRVKKTEGEMGYDEQELLLKAASDIIPKCIEVILAADRIERRLLVLTISLYWAVSTGMMPREVSANYKKKSKDL